MQPRNLMLLAHRLWQSKPATRPARTGQMSCAYLALALSCLAGHAASAADLAADYGSPWAGGGVVQAYVDMPIYDRPDMERLPKTLSIFGAFHAASAVEPAPVISVPIGNSYRHHRRYRAWEAQGYRPWRRQVDIAHYTAPDADDRAFTPSGPVVVWRARPLRQRDARVDPNLDLIRADLPATRADAPLQPAPVLDQPVVELAPVPPRTIRHVRCNRLPVYQLGIAPPTGDGCQPQLDTYQSP